MKRRPTRDIPDFSQKGPKSRLNQKASPPPPEIESHVNEPKPHSAAPKVKPPATSVKFGRRGA